MFVPRPTQQGYQVPILAFVNSLLPPSLPVVCKCTLPLKAVFFFHIQVINMAGAKVAHAVLKGPSVTKEIFIGLGLGLVAGTMWKMHHWNEQRKVRSFYDMLEKGQISVVVEE